MVRRPVPFQADRRRDEVGRVFVPACSMGQQAEQMEGVGLVGLDGENPAADLLGKSSLAGTIMRHRDGQCLRNRCHSVNNQWSA